MLKTKTTTQLGLEEKLIQILRERKLLTEAEIFHLRNRAQSLKRPLLKVLEESGFLSDEDLAQVKSKLYNIPYIDLLGRTIRRDILTILPKEMAYNYKMICFDRRKDKIYIALLNPQDFKALEAVEFLAREKGWSSKIHIASEAGLRYALRQYETLATEIQEALEYIKEGTVKTEGAEVKVEEKGLEEIARTAPVSKIVNVIIRHGVEGGASDIHIEPLEYGSRIRYRIDGVMHTAIVLPKHLHASVVSRIKVLSNLKIDETRKPQDGRFRMKIGNRQYDFRVSTLPLMGQEKVVLRVLETQEQILTLEDLGFEGRALEIMRKNIRKPHGMFIICGPTGSGKSTTLYAILRILNDEGVNIVTLEDPIEYYLTGVNQSQINPEVGLTFASGLRAILRQDPDIIMVGEIRDIETAELAVHAALTGHIVLTTLHTNDALGAIPRLIDMKLAPYLLASSLNIVVAQRLVRKICSKCKKSFKAPLSVEEEILKEIKKIPPQFLPKDLNLKPPFTLYKGTGCVHCDNMGYKGRTVIFEVFEVDDKVKEMIHDKADPLVFKKEFTEKGMFTMKQDGVFKALKGITTMEEVLKVTKD